MRVISKLYALQKREKSQCLNNYLSFEVKQHPLPQIIKALISGNGRGLKEEA